MGLGSLPLSSASATWTAEGPEGGVSTLELVDIITFDILWLYARHTYTHINTIVDTIY